MFHSRQGVRVLLFALALSTAGAQAHDSEQADAALKGLCEQKLTAAEPAPKTEPAPAAAKAPVSRKWTLESFFDPNPENNLAIQHPFTVANAAERTAALNKHLPAREALDPVYRIKPVKIYPMLAGEHPATQGRMVVGQEEPLANFVAFVESLARGDRSGKSLGFPGNAGTGKTELLYVFYFLQKNLGKTEAKYKKFSYRFKGLYNIPYLRGLHKFMPDGKTPISEYFDPDIARSPFTLLRDDMKDAVLSAVKPEIRSKWQMTLEKGWKAPEPKSAKILQVIFEHEFPEIAEGQLAIDDLTQEQYLATLNKYLVIVPHSLIRPAPSEPQFLRATSDNPNYQSMFVAPNIERMAKYGQNSPFAVDYTGDVFRAEDTGILGIDELFRAQGEFLNIALELIQNRIAKVDYGDPVELDVVPIWNSNDESISLAGENHAIKALLNRTESPPMRSLLGSNQIEAVVPFQVGVDRFKMRKLDDTTIKPLVHADVYPAADAHGKTHTAHGRYALYYSAEGRDILISPYAMNYLSWFASATRFVTDRQKLGRFQAELNILNRNSSLVGNPIERVRLHIGDKEAKPTELMELSRIAALAEEGTDGISARHIESWMKRALKIAADSGQGVLTPRMIDTAFQELMDNDKNFKPKDDIRAVWQNLREAVKLELLLPKLGDEVRSIVSGDGQQAERMYDEIERQMIAVGSDPGATEVAPEDGSQRVLIDHERLLEIRKIYAEKFGKEFSPTFLLRNLSNVRRGTGANRDPDLLEAVKIYIARKHVTVAEFITALDSFYRGEAKDPAIRQKAAEIEPTLSAYGYDSNSFREAVAFVAQLKIAEQLALKKRQQQPQ
jgi:predicted Ser/Thr protein kinase